MPCYNKEYELQRILEAYDGQDLGEKFEIIAVDDGSTDGTFDLLSRYRSASFDLQVHRLAKNSGPAAARNLGIAAARSPLILFVGDDIMPAKDFILQHLNAHERIRDINAAILGLTTWPQDLPLNAVMVHIDGIGAEQFSYHYMKEGQEYDFRHFYTSNISMKADFLRSAHPWFDTTFTYAAYEDVELGYRLSKKGLSIIYSSGPRAYHYHYHNVWTFSRRQYRAGLMACHLIRKHPELSSTIRGRFWRLGVLKMLVAAYFYTRKTPPVEYIEKIALYEASRVENDLQTPCHELFGRLFRYFFNKGLLHGSGYPKSLVRIMTSYLAASSLSEWFNSDFTP